jgi:hypothetical protein
MFIKLHVIFSVQNCFGAIDDTHVPISISLDKAVPFRNRKGTLSQNVMASCDYKMLKDARKQSRVSWDERRCMIQADPPIWDNIIKLSLFYLSSTNCPP